MVNELKVYYSAGKLLLSSSFCFFIAYLLLWEMPQADSAKGLLVQYIGGPLTLVAGFCLAVLFLLRRRFPLVIGQDSITIPRGLFPSKTVMLRDIGFVSISEFRGRTRRTVYSIVCRDETEVELPFLSFRYPDERKILDELTARGIPIYDNRYSS